MCQLLGENLWYEVAANSEISLTPRLSLSSQSDDCIMT